MKKINSDWVAMHTQVTSGSDVAAGTIDNVPARWIESTLLVRVSFEKLQKFLKIILKTVWIAETNS